MLFSHKNHIFDNNSLHFSKQDLFFSLLLALFILALPFTALLSYGRLLLLLSLLLLFYFALRRGFRLSSLGAEEVLLLCFFATLLAGLGKAGAAHATLLCLVWLPAALLPPLLGAGGVTVGRMLALTGGTLGLCALCEAASGAAQALWSDSARFGALARSAFPFGNPNLLGAFLAPCAVFALAEWLGARGRGKKILFFSFLLFSLTGLLLTYSRGAWLGFFSGALFLLLPLWCQKKRTRTLAVFPTLPVFKRLGSILSPDSSVLYRFSLWRSVAKVPLKGLLFGAGEGKAALYALLSPYMAAGLERVEHTHSLYLHILTAEGLLGLAFFLAFLFLRFYRRKNTVANGALLSLLIFGLFDDPLYSGQIGVLFWLLANVN